LDRLEELFVKYRHKDSYIKLGKMLVETPFVNPQDSRLKPSAFQGLWLDWNEGHRFELNAGVFNKVSPRSTTEWVYISESIGLYDHYQNEGTASPINRDINLWILGGHIKLNENTRFHNWQYYINQYSYVNFNQFEWCKSAIKLGLQYVFQNGLDEKQLFSEQDLKQESHIVSARMKWIKPRWQVSYNVTQGLSVGRFTFPKEWHAKPFYTFISRHRIEAFHEVNSHAVKLDAQPFRTWKQLNIGLYLARTIYEDVNELTNTRNSRSLSQISLDLQARLRDNGDNLSFMLLNTFILANEVISNPILKEERHLTQLIVNFKF
jgi:hypothetical protein